MLNPDILGHQIRSDKN